jgi:pyrroloquinoline quinone (PQQ) biosynthesis protein C
LRLSLLNDSALRLPLAYHSIRYNLAAADDLTIQQHLLQNLMDEEVGSPNHPELWMTFAKALRVIREQVEIRSALARDPRLIHRFHVLCSKEGTSTGLAAWYAYEVKSQRGSIKYRITTASSSSEILKT